MGPAIFAILDETRANTEHTSQSTARGAEKDGCDN
jgi:hypothetical protein